MTRSQYDELIEHAREDAPNECCGYLRMRDGRVEEVFRAGNEMDSPYGFRLDSKSLFAMYSLVDEGFRVAVYHSHPRSEPKPSQQDRNVLGDPEVIYLIVSLTEEPPVRAWWIKEGRVTEEPIELV